MTKQEILDKWEKDLEMWRRVAEDRLMYTKEDRLKALHHSQLICAMKSDLEKLNSN